MRRTSRKWMWIGWLAVAMGSGGLRAQSPPPPPGLPAQGPVTDERVLQAVERGIGFLLKDVDPYLEKAANGVGPGGREMAPGAVPVALGADAGTLMLHAYALFYAGRELRTPNLSLRDGRIGALKEIVVGWDSPKEFPHQTYTTALQALALSELPRLPEVDAAMKRAGQQLIGGMNANGGYSYSLLKAGGVDQSNSQYGLLGVWAAAEWGVPVPPNYWQISSAHWRRTQAVNGGWPYAAGGATTPSMTAAGLASVYLCNEYTDRSARVDAPFDPALERGLAALAVTFDPTVMDLYYLYGLERVALAGGHKYLGKRNWYQESTEALLKAQRADGSFVSASALLTPAQTTAYAVVYLLRGRTPVLMNKLQYDGAWNQRPRDSANVHAALSRTFERRLNWQVVPFSAPVMEWMDAPILLITGNKDPEFSDEQVDKLRAYVGQGGMIFSVAVAGGTIFSDAMARYAARVVGAADPPSDPSRPAPRAYTPGWRELPGGHALFTLQEAPEALPPLMGMSNGIREVWVHAATDLSAMWQTRAERKFAWDVPSRLFLYAAGKEGLRSRLHRGAEIPEPTVPPARGVSMARVQFAGNWNPEPGAWDRLAKVLARDAGTALTLSTMPAENLVALPRAQRPKLVHLAGAGPLALGEPAQRALRDYVLNGGTLFVEAVGGDGTFGRDARELLARIFPQGRLRPVPRDYVLYSGAFSSDAVRVGPVDYRRAGLDPARVPRDGDPRLEFLTVNNRLGVVFSEHDVTHGLLNLDTAGIAGYAPASAQALARNLVLFAAINQRQ